MEEGGPMGSLEVLRGNSSIDVLLAAGDGHSGCSACLPFEGY